MKNLIALTGPMRCGKSTATKYLKYKLESIGYIVKINKFAQTLYDLQSLIYNRLGKTLADKDRVLLQLLGTNWGRNTIDQNIWVNSWKRDLNIIRQSTSNEKKLIVICDDLRFDNEAEAVRFLGGSVVKLLGEQRSGETLTNVSHESELGISERYINYYINNNEGKDKLKFCVNKLIEILNIKEYK